MRNKKTGFTLIEMLVGIVIGMIVVAAASVMMVTVLKSQKDITASARLNQELGAAMAVMSNEIRRAGFRICDMKKMAEDGLACPDNDDGDEVPYIRYNTSDPSDPSNPSPFNKDLEVIGGNCILYRYNADVNADDDPEEHRGFRLNGDIIQMAGPGGNVTCSSGTWVDLTNPDVMKVSSIPGFNLFSTTGSKCRNMTLPDPNPDPAVIAQYWVVKDITATGMACESGTTPVDFYVAIDDPTDPLKNPPTVTVPFTGVAVNSIPVELKPGHQIFGTRQIRITLEATLTRDTTVTKRLESSVKVANPRVHCWPYSDHAACSPP